MKNREHPLRDKIKSIEKQRNRFLNRMNFGKMLNRFGERGFDPFEDGLLLGLLRVAFRLLLIYIFSFASTQILVYIASYLGSHILLSVVGEWIFNTHEKKLRELGEKVYRMREAYYTQKLSENGISCGCINFPNDVQVTEDRATLYNRKNMMYMTIYNMETGDGMSGFNAKKSENDAVVNEAIPSIQFNKKFGVVAKKGAEIKAVKFISPAVQLKMIESPEIRNFSKIKIEPEQVQIELVKPVNNCDIITKPMNLCVDDIFSRKFLMKYFTSIDEYCERFRHHAEMTNARIVKMRFLLEREI